MRSVFRVCPAGDKKKETGKKAVRVDRCVLEMKVYSFFPFPFLNPDASDDISTGTRHIAIKLPTKAKMEERTVWGAAFP